MKKPFTIALIGAAVIFIVIAILSKLPEKRITDIDITRATIHRCEWIQRHFNDLTGSDLETFVALNEKKGFTLNQQFSSMIVNLPADINYIVNTNMLPIQDAWGNQLEFVWRTNIANGDAGSVLLAKTNPIIIWSIGPNKKNEYGKGDDVF